MKELKSSGPWPRHAWRDIVHATAELQKEGVFCNYVLVGPKKILRVLQQLLPATGNATTYEKALIDNEILEKIIMLKNRTEDYVLIHGSETNYKAFSNIETKFQIIKLTDITFIEERFLNEVSDEELYEALRRHIGKWDKFPHSLEHIIPVILEILQRQFTVQNQR